MEKTDEKEVQSRCEREGGGAKKRRTCFCCIMASKAAEVAGFIPEASIVAEREMRRCGTGLGMREAEMR